MKVHSLLLLAYLVALVAFATSQGVNNGGNSGSNNVGKLSSSDGSCRSALANLITPVGVLPPACAAGPSAAQHAAPAHSCNTQLLAMKTLCLSMRRFPDTVSEIKRLRIWAWPHDKSCWL